MNFDEVRKQFRRLPYIEREAIESATKRYITFDIGFGTPEVLSITLDFKLLAISYTHTIKYSNGTIKVRQGIVPMTCRKFFIPKNKDLFIRYTNQYPVEVK